MLSNAQERAWYTSHRDQILRGGRHQAGDTGDGTAASESPYGTIDFASYVARDSFSGFSDGESGFFAVFRRLFDRLATEEQTAYQRQKAVSKGLKPPAARPSFGASDSADADVTAFYHSWSSFQSIKDFAWLDAYNAAAEPMRRIRRLMEAENEKHRKAGKKEFVADVRAAVDAAREQNPRLEAIRVRCVSLFLCAWPTCARL